MPATEPPRADASLASFWPWLALIVGLLWTSLLRAPLLYNARAHLDSDLAVDGLTLLDAIHGHLRWHYPGTPHIGTAPIVLSIPATLIWGVGPETLVSGGTLAWLLVVLATFLLARAVVGPASAVAAIAPLVFSSTGTLWLSARITGGHLLILAWHAGALAGLAWWIQRTTPARAFLLGLWCGLGLWHDALFLFSLAGLLPAAGLAWSLSGRSEPLRPSAYRFAAGLLLGLVPAILGRLFDPYNAYGAQFQPTFSAALLYDHTQLLLLKCLPRLLIGHQLPDLRMFMGVGDQAVPAPQIGAPAILGILGLFLLSLAAFGRACVKGNPVSRPVCLAAAISTVLVTIAFVLNRNIYNADNYRYLVFWLLPWAIGFGLLVRRFTSAGWVGRLAGLTIVGLLAGVLTLDAWLWYGKHRWIGGDLLPVRAPSRPARALAIEPLATHVFGDYWDVYRESFLSGGKVRAIPLPFYPDRFPGWSSELSGHRGLILILNPSTDWRGLLEASWTRDGSDPQRLADVSIRAPVPIR